MKGWTETEGEYRQRLRDEAVGALEKHEGEARLAVRPTREKPPTLPVDYWQKYNASLTKTTP